VFLALVLVCRVSALADCRVRTGDHIVLYGTSDDPKVFVWDSRFRMREYEGGTFDQAQALLPHALLADPWTRAIVSACVNNFVQYRDSSTGDDAIGILIVSGPLHGQRGWVLGSDIRNMQDSAPNHRRHHR
jgi:hypothetical protein